MEKQEKITAESEMVPPIKSKSSREPLFGMMLLVFIGIIFLAIVGGVVWGGYHGWRLNKEEEALVSIGNLARKEMPTQEVTATKKEDQNNLSEQSDPAASSEEQILMKAKATEIMVLNGGAAKGSAGTVTELLKKEGFSKAATGNTLGNYTGTVVYFTTDFEKEAGAVQKVLMKTYPKAEVKGAVKENKETTQVSITVILGR